MSSPASIHWRNALPLALINAAVWFIYWPALCGGWLWDDTFDITENDVTRAPGGLWRIWFQPGSELDYYPVKASAQWVQWHLWGEATLGYHVTNVVLHIISALLVWKLLSKLGLRLAWLGGLIFAVHPVMVESVAWMAELKNTLSLPPFLMAMICWINYDRGRRLSDGLAALGLFLLAMLTKPTMVMFPVIILLHAWWRRGRIGKRDVLEAVPFFAISLALGLIVFRMPFWYAAIHHVQPEAVHQGTLISRIVLAGLCLAFYFCKVILPVGLMPIYPVWSVEPPSATQSIPCLAIAGLLVLLWSRHRTWGRHALLGLGFFAIMLLPFVSLNVGGFTAFTRVMDHFLYIPILGLIGLAVAGLEWLAGRLRSAGRAMVAGAVAISLLAMTLGSHDYAACFRNAEAFWTYAVERNPTAWVALNNLGKIYAESGRVPQAVVFYHRALLARPGQADIYNNLGLAENGGGNFPQALRDFAEALRLRPDFATAAYNRGAVLEEHGKIMEALASYREAIRLRPNYPEACNNAAILLFRMQRLPEARQYFEEALQEKPDFAEAHANLGSLLAAIGESAGARAEFQEALRLHPSNSTARQGMERLDRDSR